MRIELFGRSLTDRYLFLGPPRIEPYLQIAPRVQIAPLCAEGDRNGVHLRSLRSFPTRRSRFTLRAKLHAGACTAERNPSAVPRASEIRRFGLRDREQVLAEMIAVVLGTDHLQTLVLHRSPTLNHVERFVERIGILDGYHGFERLAVGGQLEALDDVLLFAVRRTIPVEEAIVGL